MKIRLGIIGTGIAARDLHLPALRNLHDKFEIVCVCNHTEKKAKEFSILVGGVPYYLDYHELLSQKDVDAVDIVLPIHLNYQVTRDAAEASKHVIVEKPIASNLEDAQRMLDLSKKCRTVMMVAENYRYNPVFMRIREIIKEGRIGNPYAVFWDCFALTASDNKYARTTWRIHHKYPGGFVMDAGIHNIAVLRDLFGEIRDGVALTRSVNPEIGKMDSMSFLFAFENGVNGVFNSYFSVRGQAENKLKVLGSDGTLVADGNRIILNRGAGGGLEENIQTDRGYTGQFEDFHRAIVENREPVSTFEKAFGDFRTMVSALDSSMKWQTSELTLRS